MPEDRYGLALSTNDEAAAAYVHAIDAMLAGDGQIEAKLDAVVEADPDFALAHAAIARQHQLMGRGKDARTAAEQAASLAAGATAREQRHVEIINLLTSGQIPASLDLLKEHLAEYPRDAFVLEPACGVFGSIGFSGRIGREPEQLALLEPLVDAYGDDWWFRTVHAFALLENGRWEEARDLTYASLEQRPSNPHGGHTLAHALYEGGADDEAIGFFDRWMPDLDRGSIIHCHNWWHYALLLMGAGRMDDALAAYDGNLMPGTTESTPINIFTDRASFLWRAELAGNERDDARWADTVDYYEECFRRPIVFVDAHAGLGYAALGRTEELGACIEQLQELGEGGRLPADTIAADLSRAYAAFTESRWSDVVDILQPLEPQVVRIGGSRAQRDLMTNTLLAALINDDRPDEAASLLAEITDRQPRRPVAGLAG